MVSQTSQSCRICGSKTLIIKALSSVLLIFFIAASIERENTLFGLDLSQPLEQSEPNHSAVCEKLNIVFFLINRFCFRFHRNTD